MTPLERHLFCMDVWTYPSEDVLVRVLMLLRKHLVCVRKLTMRDRDGRRHLELEVELPPAKLELVAGRVRALIEVDDVVTWSHSATREGALGLSGAASP